VEEALQRLLSPRSADLTSRALARRLTRLDEESQLILQDGSPD
jgi:hypothetical protein